MGETQTFDCSDWLSGGQVDPNVGSYSVVELAHEHRKRWLFQTSAGVIVLRRLPLRCHRAIETARAHLSPKLAEYHKRLQVLAPLVDGIPEDQQDPKVKEEIQLILDTIAMSDMGALGVIESPALYTLEEYDDLLAKLTEAERDVLMTAVATLSRVRPSSDVDMSAEVVAERLGLKLWDGDMLPSMTVSQAAYWLGRIQAEHRERLRLAGNR